MIRVYKTPHYGTIDVDLWHYPFNMTQKAQDLIFEVFNALNSKKVSILISKTTCRIDNLCSEYVEDISIVISQIISSNKVFIEDTTEEQLHFFKDFIVPVVEVDRNWDVIGEIFPIKRLTYFEIKKRKAIEQNKQFWYESTITDTEAKVRIASDSRNCVMCKFYDMRVCTLKHSIKDSKTQICDEWRYVA